MAKRPCGGERAASIFVIQGARSSAQAIGDTWSVDAVLHMPGEGERHGVGASETVIKAGSDEFFVTAVRSNTVTGTAATTSRDVTLTPFFSGVALDVTPQIL